MKNISNLKITVCFVICLAIYLGAFAVENVKGQCSPPTLSVVTGQNFDELTISWTGVSSDTQYLLFASNDGGQTYILIPVSYIVQEGQQKTITTDQWGTGGGMQTYHTYHFYLSHSCGQSNIASATTRDIGTPFVTLSEYETNKAKLTWNETFAANNYVETYDPQKGVWCRGCFNTTSPQYENENLFSKDQIPIAPGTWRIYRIFVSRNGREKVSNMVIGYFNGDRNLGPTMCYVNVGKPVNVSNGNMYLTHRDYGLNGMGEQIDISRTYNSQNQMAGFFGHGWTTMFDEN